jgi:hypothetical protein
MVTAAHDVAMAQDRPVSDQLATATTFFSATAGRQAGTVSKAPLAASKTAAVHHPA